MPGHPPPLRTDCALFLDIDGTLIEFCDDPRSTRADDSLTALLTDLAQELNGALALISGRSIGRIDELFAPLRLAVAGQHGIERRGADGRLHAADPVDPALDAVRSRFTALATVHPGLLVEDKGRSIALHYRRAPECAATAHATAADLVHALGPDYHAQSGNRVVEIKARHLSKGTAIAAFCQEAPFRERRPVFVGDDLTDLDGFRWVDAHGGASIAVGDRVSGRFHLEDPAAVRAWLAQRVRL